MRLSSSIERHERHAETRPPPRPAAAISGRFGLTGSARRDRLLDDRDALAARQRLDLLAGLGGGAVADRLVVLGAERGVVALERVEPDGVARRGRRSSPAARPCSPRYARARPRWHRSGRRCRRAAVVGDMPGSATTPAAARRLAGHDRLEGGDLALAGRGRAGWWGRARRGPRRAGRAGVWSWTLLVGPGRWGDGHAARLLVDVHEACRRSRSAPGRCPSAAAAAAAATSWPRRNSMLRAARRGWPPGRPGWPAPRRRARRRAGRPPARRTRGSGRPRWSASPRSRRGSASPPRW